MFQNGGAVNEPFVYKYLGVNPVNGNLLFESAGYSTEAPVQADKKSLPGKNFLPKYQGFSLTLV
jgi:hypothetical protein